MIAPLLIRADGGAGLGAGHVMRCLALAQAWQQGGGRACFVQAATSPALLGRLRDAGCASVSIGVEPGGAADAAQTIRHAQAAGAAWVVGDSYHFDAAWQRQVRAAGLRLLLLDDYGHASHYHADLVLNPNLAADAARYARREAHTRLLLGTRYALLRREFVTAPRPVRAFSAPARRVLVTLGGSDPANFTARVVAAVARLPGLETRVVIGGSNPHRAALEAAVAEHPAMRCEVDAADMPGLMAWADVAITAGGSTLWELAYMGLPALVLTLAENQAPAVRALGAAGVVQPLDAPGEAAALLAALQSDATRRQQMSAAALRLADGRGGERVVAEMEAA